MKTHSPKYSLQVCVLIGIMVSAVTLINHKWDNHVVIKSDVAGYYVYLPAIFIYNDLLDCNFYPHIDSTYNLADGVVYYGVQYCKESHHVYYKYNYGVALFEFPLFMVAHIFAKNTHFFKADGYSVPYQMSVAASAILFAFLALLLLRAFLLHYFDEKISAITLLIMGLGTNFLAQNINQPGMSHLYLFFLFSLLLYASQKFYETFEWKYAAMIGFAGGMVAVTRGIDIFVCLFPLLWGIKKHNSLKTHFPKILIALFVASFFVGIQLLYWKVATGHWYYHTYMREHFVFSNWQIINGLFSYRKGWFIYTPLAILGFIGCLNLWKRQDLRFFLLPFSLYFSIMLYLIFCWWQWYYGGSFGCRVLVESLSLLALPIAAFVEWIFAQKKALKLALICAIFSLIFLNIFQTAQYERTIIHWQKMNKAYYWRVFGKLTVTEEDRLLLNQTEEIDTPPP